MISFRKIAAFCMSLTILAGLAAGCSPTGTNTSVTTTKGTAMTTASQQTTSEETSASAARVKTRISVLKGPTGIGMVKLMADQDAGQTELDYTFSISGTPDDVVAQITSNQVDIAALPSNLAATLYQKTNRQIHLLAINTLGVLHILENGQSVNGIADLAGKKILATGQGSVPEYVLTELIRRAGIAGQVTIEYKAEHSELATLAASGQADLVMLPEPFATTVLAKNTNFREAVDLSDAWEESQGETDGNGLLAMGCLVVTSRFAEANPDAVNTFLMEYGHSTDYVVNNPVPAGKLVAQYGILADANLAAKAIPNCHIIMISDDQMAETLNPLLRALFAANPKSIGGKMPEQDFYELP